jgi:hypothetical protein
MMNWNGRGSDRGLLYGIILLLVWNSLKIPQILRYNSRNFGRETNPEPPKPVAKVFTPQPPNSVKTALT